MDTIGKVLTEKFATTPSDWTDFTSLTDTFTGEEEVVRHGRELCEEMQQEADYFEIENGTRFWIDGPSWTVT
jgi:hypothetical protein